VCVRILRPGRTDPIVVDCHVDDRFGDSWRAHVTRRSRLSDKRLSGSFPRGQRLYDRAGKCRFRSDEIRRSCAVLNWIAAERDEQEDFELKHSRRLRGAGLIRAGDGTYDPDPCVVFASSTPMASGGRNQLTRARRACLGCAEGVRAIRA
jgi:hypothetical protein